MRKPVILFVDEVCNKPYDPDVLDTEALGGTEATVIRIAEGLANTDLFKVYVEQHNRTEVYGKTLAWYVPPNGPVDRADYVISLRAPGTLLKAKIRYPGAKHYLWNHDLMSTETARETAKQSDFTAIAVSNFHKTQIVDVLKPQGYEGQFQVKVIYNPISDALVPSVEPIDRNKLVFFSSPHKGLDHALELFFNLRSFNPDFKLYIGNPGYLSATIAKSDSIVELGPLPHSKMLDHVRDSLCVFYPNFVFPETFGLVFAEADAVGTPVISHPIGAASEVLYHPYEMTDCRNPKNVIDRVMSWYGGDRLKVKGQDKFRLSTVLKSWMRLFS